MRRDFAGSGGKAGGADGRGCGPVPGPCSVPELTPVRPGRGCGHRMRRLVRGRRRVAAAGLAVAAAAFAFQLPRDGHVGPASAQAARESPPGPTAAPARPHERPPGGREPPATVLAPVRIADAAAVRLLHRGDRVDVIAGSGGAEEARLVARRALVDGVPGPGETDPVGGTRDGALVVLRVPRATATALAGAGAGGRLAVTLC